jgi:hypothetical protein
MLHRFDRFVRHGHPGVLMAMAAGAGALATMLVAGLIALVLLRL